MFETQKGERLKMNPVINLMKSHRSVRKFKSDPVDSSLLNDIIEAAKWASTSSFIQAYSVIHVEDKNSRSQIAQLAGPQPWVEKSPVFLVFCADLNRVRKACAHENTEMASGYMEMLIVSTVDASLLAQNTMLAAESCGLGGVFIGGIRNDPETVCRLLKLPDQVYPVFGMCLGYPDEKQEQKPRLPVEMVLNKDTYNDGEIDFDPYNSICRDYYQKRSSTSRDDTWTNQIAALTSKLMRPHMKLFLEKRGFAIK